MVAESVRAPTYTYFRHVEGGRAPERMTDTTRYLCAAAYLDDDFRTRVIRELVDDPHRAIVPSYGFDIGPVVTHCLRARGIRLAYDVAMSGLLFFAFLISPLSVLGYLGWAAPFAIVSRIPWRRLPWRRRIWLILAIGVLIWCVIPLFLLVLYGAYAAVAFGVEPTGYLRRGLMTPWTDPWLGELVALAVFGGMLGLAFGYRIHVHAIMRRELPPNAPTPASQAGAGSRIGRLCAAQLGNITLYSGEDPFLGAGAPESPWARAWSITLELDRPGTPGRPPGKVDPVELHEHVRRGLMAMAEKWPLNADDEPDMSNPDAELPEHERVSGLSIDYHIFARGRCNQYRFPSAGGRGAKPYPDHPLIDEAERRPFSKATDEARDAVIRHPQASLRCFQRVTVDVEGQAVRDAEKRLIVPAEGSDILVSAFIYLAVEGNMLHAQFVADVLPPVRSEFRIVDRLPALASPLWVAVRHRWIAALGEGLTAPFRAAWTIARMAIAGVTATDPARFVIYDYGATLSVRELAAEPALTTFIQELDAHKYSRLIELRMNECVLDYLQRHDIDVSAYRQQMTAITAQGVMVVHGDVTGGQFAVGISGGRVDQKTTG